MKGFAPPPRFGGAQIPHEPLPITRTITVTEGISVKDLAEKKGELVDQLQLTPPDLSEPERAIFKLLSTDTPQQIDGLAEATKLSITQLTSALLALEMRELIRALPGKSFVRRM